ncbi:MAG TPA: VOC family protein [Candidatus Elarobacter sp.]|nr:VOC family protein [Candidatus Elarobacter sp.]
MSESTTAVRSALTWFEIPTADFDRARRFYETILEKPLNEIPFGPARIAMFPYEDPGVGGCLDEGSESRPSDTGVVVYLPAHGRLDRTLELVEPAGGRVVVPKNAIPNVGFVAHIVDSEGNRIGLHSNS